MKWLYALIRLIKCKSSLKQQAKSNAFISTIVFYSDYQSPGLVL